MDLYCLAVDLGASGGRHILGSLKDGRLILEEIYRFKNGPVKTKDGLVWDADSIYKNILEGLKKCKELNKIPAFIGIDAWGADYAALDCNGEALGPVYCYRSDRTEPFLKSSPDFYSQNGTAFQPFNTLYQFLADKASGRLQKTADFLMVGEYFSYLLTGKKANEYTVAATTGLVGAASRQWNLDAVRALGLPEKLFKPLKEPDFILGEFKKDVRSALGFNARVVLPAVHDTASAGSAAPIKNAAVLSSGTWSLLFSVGPPVLTKAAQEAGYSNEGAAGGGIRLTKNIIGLYMIQQIRKESGDKLSFAGYAAEAERAADAGAFDYDIDVTSPSFFAPESMTEEVKAACRKAGQPEPKTDGEIAYCVFNSLARRYGRAVKALERVTGKEHKELCVVGGGSQNGYLNKLTARYTGKAVYAGPAEAAAIGNLAAQFIAAGALKGFGEIPGLVRNSFDIQKF